MNITKTVEQYVQRHPSIKDCLKEDMINYSKLSRQIITDLGINDNDFDAVLIACRRYSRKIKSERSYEKRIMEVLKESKIEVKNKIITVQLEKDISYKSLASLEEHIKDRKGMFNLIEGSSSITIVTSEEFLGTIKKYFKDSVVTVMKDLIEISFISQENLEGIPGVISYLSSLLSENGINILEIMSCWTDTLFVLDEKDLPRAVEVLKF